jgi:hypothetical protein
VGNKNPKYNPMSKLAWGLFPEWTGSGGLQRETR